VPDKEKSEDAENRGGVLTLADVVQIVTNCTTIGVFFQRCDYSQLMNDTPDAIVKAVTLNFARSVMESEKSVQEIPIRKLWSELAIPLPVRK
jgi:hypothetical protein